MQEADSHIDRARELVALVTREGKTCRERAYLEFQRRFCGVTGEELQDDARIAISRRDFLATVLDVRTKGCSHFTAEERREAKQILIEEVVKFEEQRCSFDVAAAAAAAAERATAAPPLAAAACSSAPSAPHTPERTATSLALQSAWTPPAHTPPPAAQAEREEVERERLVRVTREADAWLRTDFSLDAMFGIAAASDVVSDLIGLPLGLLYHKTLLQGGARDVHPMFGCIPLMASRSWGQIGSLMAESYCERMISCANLVLHDGNTLLGNEELEKLVLLRMNKKFMKYMRRTYPEVGKSFVLANRASRA